MANLRGKLPLFTYGTLMSGQSAHGLVAPAVVERASAQLHGVTLHSAGRYPVAAPGDGTVQGEALWLAEQGYAELLHALDEYEGDEYRRVVRKVTLIDDETTRDGVNATAPAGPTVDCWVYLATAQSAARYPRIMEGDWRTYESDNKNNWLT